MIAKCLGINEKGHLTVSGVDTVELAREFGTPAYILDENTVRENCRTYIDSMKKYFGEASFPLFASKALSFTEIYRIVASEGMGIDCVSPGEIYTAYKAGYPMERAYFHGNNKTDADIEMALDAGVGCFVVDNREELVALDAAAGKRGKIQKILLRISPGIDPHTHRKVVTGSVDSKFGTAIETGQAMEMVKASIQLILKFAVIIVIVLAIVIGAVLGGIELGLFINLIVNLLIGAAAFVIYPSMLHRGI